MSEQEFFWEVQEEEESETDFSQEITRTITADYYSSPICTFRRALDKDIPEVETIVTDSALNIFGGSSVEVKIKRCFYSMVALNANDRIVAVICLDDHPNIAALPKSEWEIWVIRLYGLLNLNSQNTLWIHLLVCHPNYTYIFVKPLLEHVYLNFPYLIHIVFVLPGGLPCFCFLEENFTRVMPMGYLNPHKVQTLYLTLRYHYLEKYKIRLAVEEDNDDIVQIIDNHSERLREIYGDFYVSEILTKFTDMNRKIIVAELAERAVGVLFLNGDLNYNQLIENFNLEPFTNLHAIEDEVVVKHQKTCTKQKSSQMDQDLGSLTSRSTHVDSLTDLSLRDEQSLLDDEDITVFEILDFDRFGFLLDSGTTFFDTPNDEPDFIGETLSQTSSLRLFTSDMHLEVSDSSCQSRKDMEFQMKYKRKSAFVLEIMAAGEEHEQQIICDLLEASFQSFTKKKKEYCVFSTVHNLPHFPLFNFFVRAIPKWSNLYPRELYILHKNAIKACLKVRKINRGDYKKVKNLISNMALSTVLLDTVTKSLFGADKELKTYVLFDHSVLIGFIVIREERNPEYYFEYYECYKYIDFYAHRYDRYGHIQFCTLSPLFHKHMQFFLREVHRITGMSILFYLQHKRELSRKVTEGKKDCVLFLFEKAQNALFDIFRSEIDDTAPKFKNLNEWTCLILTRIKPLAGILKDMIPVLVRSQPDFRNICIPEIEFPLCTIQRNSDPNYALFVSTRRLCSLPRIEINNRVVVVGCGYTSTSFLESLISHFDGERHVLFNNLSVVFDRAKRSPVELAYHKFIPLMFLYRGKHNAARNNSASFRTHVNYIQGSMTAIDRKMKYITINQEVILPYDYLFLMCGTQYHQPYAPGVRKDKVTEPCPQNFFIVNNYGDAEKAFRKLYEHISHRKNRQTTIVVYGSDIPTYACLCVLDKMRLPQTSIKFVEPIPHETERPSVDPFNNPAIYDAFHDILFLTGIEVHTGYYFFEWEVDPKENIVHHVKYQSRKGAIFFNCDFIFHYANKEVKHDTFAAVNNAGLVYDGKLVITPDGRTNDPNIYGAGPMTKYSRRYFANRFVHRYYQSSEIGQRMGRQIRAMLLPGGLKANKGDEIFNILNNPNTNKLVPQYTEPIVTSCMLPGKINYFEIRNPGKPVPLETQKNVDVFFETGSLKRIELNDDPEYFRIAFGKNNRVKEICCFTRREIEVENYQKLWGQHEQCLNNLYARFKKGMILNFYEYFKHPGFCAIYLDRFSELQNNLRKIMALLSNEKGKSMIEDIVKRLVNCNWGKLTAAQEAIVKRKFINSPYQKKMIEEIMKFLEMNSDSLPMYAHPLITNMILYDVESSPLFRGVVDTSTALTSYGD